jgi:lysophospholipase L1-like esterase
MISRRLLLLGPAALTAAAEHVPVAATPISRLDTPWWRERHQQKLAELREGRVDLIWLGDSITQDWEMQGPPAWRDFAPVWHRFYGDRNAVNLGFKGDSTAHLLWRMQNGELDGIKPKLAIILIGANNMGRVHWSAPQTEAGIAAVVAELQRRLPGTGVVLLSVLPSVRSKWVTRTTNQVNRALAARYPAGSAVRFIDLTSLFASPEGQVDRTLFYDDLLTPPDPPLHPTAQAQERIAETIEPTVAAVMGDRNHLSR